MQFGGARWSLGGPGWSLGAAGGLSGDYRAQNECLRKFEKGCFWPPGRGFGGSSLCYSKDFNPQWC